MLGVRSVCWLHPFAVFINVKRNFVLVQSSFPSLSNSELDKHQSVSWQYVNFVWTWIAGIQMFVGHSFLMHMICLGTNTEIETHLKWRRRISLRDLDGLNLDWYEPLTCVSVGFTLHVTIMQSLFDSIDGTANNAQNQSSLDLLQGSLACLLQHF